MPNSSKNDIILVRYPFSDLSGAKVRPAVMLVIFHTYHEEAENSARVRLISARKATKNERKQYQRK